MPSFVVDLTSGKGMERGKSIIHKFLIQYDMEEARKTYICVKCEMTHKDKQWSQMKCSNWNIPLKMKWVYIAEHVSKDTDTGIHIDHTLIKI